MPIALTDQGAQRWLAAGTNTTGLRERLINGRYNAYESWPISTEVNNPENDKPSVAEPI